MPIDIAQDLGVVPPPLPAIETIEELVASEPIPPPQIINGLLHKGLVFGHSNGWVQKKGDVIADMENGSLSYRSFLPESLRIERMGKRAIVKEYVQVQGDRNGTPCGQTRQPEGRQATRERTKGGARDCWTLGQASCATVGAPSRDGHAAETWLTARPASNEGRGAAPALSANGQGSCAAELPSATLSMPNASAWCVCWAVVAGCAMR